MAFLNGIFGNGNQQQQQRQPQGNQQQQVQNNQQQQPGNQNQQQQNQQQTPGGGGGLAANQMQQNANSQLQPGGNPANPMDPFLQLMTPSQEVLQQQNQQQQMQGQSLFGNLKPEDIQAQVKKTNFAANIDPAKAQKALGGDMQSFMEVINEVAQNAFHSSLQMTQGMVEHGVKTGNDRFSQSLDSRFKNFQLSNQNSKNPALQHPIGQALLKTVKQQIATANPRMSPEEVHAKGEEMFSAFAQMLNPQQQSDGKDGSNGSSGQEQDWMAFLEQ